MDTARLSFAGNRIAQLTVDAMDPVWQTATEVLLGDNPLQGLPDRRQEASRHPVVTTRLGVEDTLITAFPSWVQAQTESSGAGADRLQVTARGSSFCEAVAATTTTQAFPVDCVHYANDSMYLVPLVALTKRVSAALRAVT